MEQSKSEPIRVLITGGTGFVGGEIVKALSEQHPEYDLYVVDLNPPPAATSTAHFSKATLLRADVTTAEEIDKAFATARPHVVVHTAGYVPKQNNRYSQVQRDLTFHINVDGTKVVLEAAQRYAVKAFILTSSCTVITDSQSPLLPNMTETLPLGHATLIYGQSKTLTESLVLSANTPSFPTCALRPSTLFGEADYNLIPTIHSCIAKFETPFIIGSGTNLYDFSYAPNIADAHVLAIENLLSTRTAAGEAFFISNGEPLPFRAFCLAVWKEFGHFPPFEIRLPVRLAYWFGYLAEWGSWWTGQPAALCRGAVVDSCQTAYASLEKARRVLGYEPRVGVKEGLRVACEAYRRRLEGSERRKEKVVL